MSRHESAETHRKLLKKNGLRFQAASWKGSGPRCMCPACRLRAFRASASQGRAPRTRRASPESRAPSPESRSVFSATASTRRASGRCSAARNLNTASEARFQDSLPFEPVNRARLERLRAERSTARAALKSGSRSVCRQAAPGADRRTSRARPDCCRPAVARCWRAAAHRSTSLGCRAESQASASPTPSTPPSCSCPRHGSLCGVTLIALRAQAVRVSRVPSPD